MTMDSPTTATMIDALPAKQRQVLEAIMAFITDNGYPHPFSSCARLVA
ncbi:MAG: hypothetical protein R2857_09625 [Vampirovibrionales bacterium]